MTNRMQQETIDRMAAMASAFLLLEVQFNIQSIMPFVVPKCQTLKSPGR